MVSARSGSSTPRRIFRYPLYSGLVDPRTGLGAMRGESCLDTHESNLDISRVQPVAYSLCEHLLGSDAHPSSAAGTGDFTQVIA